LVGVPAQEPDQELGLELVFEPLNMDPSSGPSGGGSVVGQQHVTHSHALIGSAP
jgi:hypothetical protein